MPPYPSKSPRHALRIADTVDANTSNQRPLKGMRGLLLELTWERVGCVQHSIRLGAIIQGRGGRCGQMA